MASHYDPTRSCVLQVTITHLQYSVTEKVLSQLFDVYGVNELCMLQQPTHLEVFVEFQSWYEASQARSALHGRCIYDGSCLLDIQHATPSISIHKLPNSEPVVVDWDHVETELLVSAPTPSASTSAPASIAITSTAVYKVSTKVHSDVVGLMVHSDSKEVISLPAAPHDTTSSSAGDIEVEDVLAASTGCNTMTPTSCSVLCLQDSRDKLVCAFMLRTTSSIIHQAQVQVHGPRPWPPPSLDRSLGGGRVPRPLPWPSFMCDQGGDWLAFPWPTPQGARTLQCLQPKPLWFLNAESRLHVANIPRTPMSMQIMDNHQVFEREVDTPICLDHGVNGAVLVFIVVPSAQGKWQLPRSREVLHGTNIATLLMPWDPGLRCRFGQELEDNLHNTELFSQGVGMSSGSDVIAVIKWRQGKRANGSRCIHMFVGRIFGLIRNFDVVLDYTSLWPIEVKMDARNLSICLCQQLNNGLKASSAYIMEDDLQTLVAVSLPCTCTSPRFIIWPSLSPKENAEKCIMLMGMNLHDHGSVTQSEVEPACGIGSKEPPWQRNDFSRGVLILIFITEKGVFFSQLWTQGSVKKVLLFISSALANPNCLSIILRFDTRSVKRLACYECTWNVAKPVVDILINLTLGDVVCMIQKIFRLACKFQCRSGNPGVHNQLIREVVQQRGELMIIACLYLAQAVCIWALYQDHIGDCHRTAILACNTHWGGLLVQNFGEWSNISSNTEVTYFQYEAWDQLVLSAVVVGILRAGALKTFT